MLRTVLSVLALTGLVGGSRAPPRSLVFSAASQDGAAFRAGAFLGEFKKMGRYEDRPLYRQLDTEGEHDIFLYYSAGAWWVGYEAGDDEQSALRNPSDSSTAPLTGWQYKLVGRWTGDDPTLQLVTGRLAPCPRLVVASTDFLQDISVIDTYRPSGKWSEGRPVYRSIATF